MTGTGIIKNNILETERFPLKEEVEIFENILSSKNVIIERIISGGWNKPEDEWFDQVMDEWVLLVKGNATIEFENEHKIRLKEGDYMFIPSHRRHKVTQTSAEPPCIWLAVYIRQ